MKSIIAVLLIFTSSAFAEPTKSSFAEVWEVISTDPVPKNDVERKEMAVYESGENPTYEVSTSTLFKKRPGQLEKDAKRTINKDEDYYDRIEKLLHPNGVCVAGLWNPNKDSKYTGMFANGNKGLFIGRISTALDEVRYKKKRGFGLAGKIFSTQDTNEKVKTANFFTVDKLLGNKKTSFLETYMTNEPEVGFSFSLLGMMLKVSKALSKADKNPAFRPLYPVAEAGLKEGDHPLNPKWIRIGSTADTKMNDMDDFRDEVVQSIEDNGNLVLTIDVSDETKDPDDEDEWQNIGKIELTNAVISYGCDRRLHFAHPKLRK